MEKLFGASLGNYLLVVISIRRESVGIEKLR
jgi:hypothetical protein